MFLSFYLILPLQSDQEAFLDASLEALLWARTKRNDVSLYNRHITMDPIHMSTFDVLAFA